MQTSSVYRRLFFLLYLNFIALWAVPADKLMTFFAFNFPRKQHLTFLANVSAGDNLHKVTHPIVWEKSENYIRMLSAEFFTKHAKC